MKKERHCPNDQELIDLLYRRDKDAFLQLYDKFSARLYGFILDLVAEEELAAQVLLEAFESAYHKIDSYDRTQQSLFIWLFHLAHSISLQHLRKNDAWPSNNTQTNYRGAFRAILTMIPVASKKIIELIYYHGLTKGQISQILDIPVATVESQFYTGMKLIEAILNSNSAYGLEEPGI